MKKTTKKTKIDDIFKVLHKFVKDNKGTCFFIGEIGTFDDKKNCDDARSFVFGFKKCLQVALKETVKNLKEEKEKFVNW